MNSIGNHLDIDRKTTVNSIENHLDIDRMMAENDLLLAYRDRITDSTVQQLLSIAELKLVQTGEAKRLRKRVFHILVECLQNIVKHSVKDPESDDRSSLLLIGREGDEFLIITGNRIRNAQVAKLRSRVNEINSWDHADMRDIYSERLGKSKYSKKGGAGLGLIDIYKRSGQKIGYDIHPINGQISFLSLHIRVKSN